MQTIILGQNVNIWSTLVLRTLISKNSDKGTLLEKAEANSAGQVQPIKHSMESQIGHWVFV